MCFVLQRRAIFRHRKFQKCSEPHVFCIHFHLQMCFALTAACHFLTSELAKVHQNLKKCSEPHVLCTFSLANVFRATAACNLWFLLWPHDSAPGALTGLLFDWPDTRIIEKTQHFATSLTFGADVSSFFWLSRYCVFFLLTWLLCCSFSSAFSSLHIVGSLLFQLPSTMVHYTPGFKWISNRFHGAWFKIRDVLSSHFPSSRLWTSLLKPIEVVLSQAICPGGQAQKMKASAKQEASAARKSGENEGANWIPLERVFNRNHQGGQKRAENRRFSKIWWGLVGMENVCTKAHLEMRWNERFAFPKLGVWPDHLLGSDVNISSKGSPWPAVREGVLPSHLATTLIQMGIVLASSSLSVGSLEDDCLIIPSIFFWRPTDLYSIHQRLSPWTCWIFWWQMCWVRAWYMQNISVWSIYV